MAYFGLSDPMEAVYAGNTALPVLSGKAINQLTRVFFST